MMIGGMGGTMPSMQAMQQMRERMFSKADGNGSGGLDASEFDAMVKDSPMAKMAPSGGIHSQEAFSAMDQDGSGELSADELDSAHQTMMSNLQSTLQRFAGGDMLSGAGPSSTAEGSQALDDQLRALIAQISSAYSTGSERSKSGGLAGLLGTA